MNEINNWLKSTYGTNLRGESIFRVVFSDNQLEKRFGTFRDHVGKIFIREYTAVREVPKYPHIKHRWILEKWMPPQLACSPELPESNEGSYEPIQVFEHENGNPVIVERRIIEQIIHILFHPLLPGHRKELMKTQDEKEFAKEVEHNRVILEDAGSPLKKDGEAII